MTGISEILVGGGVAAVLAAAIGGGMKAFGTEVPLIASWQRQAALFVVGLLLIVGGIRLGSQVAETPRPKAQVSGMTAVDFRSSRSEDSLLPGHGSGLLLVTTDIAVRNVTEPARSLTWSGTTATLRLGGATIPFRSYYFTNLTDQVEPWLGQHEDAGPVSIRAGEVARHEVMFIPLNTGTGRYKWDDFLRAINRPGDQNPVFEITIATAVGEAAEAPITLRCTARVDELMDDLRRLSRANVTSRWITAECGQQGG